MSKESTVLNVIRVSAMTGVLVDHFLVVIVGGGKYVENFSLWLGAVSVSIFFVLSAYLFGQKWRKGDCKPFAAKEFMTRRMKRIYVPLWLTILFIVPVQYLLTQEPDVTTILLNIAGMCWLQPFQCAGHLWYITMMVLLYGVFLFFSYVRADKVPPALWMAGLIGLAVVFAIKNDFFNSVSRSVPLLCVVLTGPIFFQGEELVAYCRNHGRSIWSASALLLTLSMAFWLSNGYDHHKGMLLLSAYSAGAVLFLAILAGARTTRESRLIGHLAERSYEIYLIHLPILELAHKYTENVICGVMIGIVCTYLLACALQNVSKKDS